MKAFRPASRFRYTKSSLPPCSRAIRSFRDTHKMKSEPSTGNKENRKEFPRETFWFSSVFPEEIPLQSSTKYKSQRFHLSPSPQISWICKASPKTAVKILPWSHTTPTMFSPPKTPDRFPASFLFFPYFPFFHLVHFLFSYLCIPQLFHATCQEPSPLLK